MCMIEPLKPMTKEDYNFHRSLRKRKTRIPEEVIRIPNDSPVLNHNTAKVLIDEEGSMDVLDFQFIEDECITGLTIYDFSSKIRHNPDDPECVCDSCCEADYYRQIDEEYERERLSEMEKDYENLEKENPTDFDYDDSYFGDEYYDSSSKYPDLIKVPYKQYQNYCKCLGCGYVGRGEEFNPDVALDEDDDFSPCPKCHEDHCVAASEEEVKAAGILVENDPIHEEPTKEEEKSAEIDDTNQKITEMLQDDDEYLRRMQ